MGKKFTFSRSIVNDLGEKEVFTAVEYDSFEEARTAVNKGIRDRLYEIDFAIKPFPISTPPLGAQIMGSQKLNPPIGEKNKKS